MEWVYLSPHLDDVALSCGGLVWEQAQAGQQVCVLTICAGDPPPGELSPLAKYLHARWNTGARAVAQRRQEDLASCRLMGATARHLSIPDCIYRRGGEEDQPLYPAEGSIFEPLHPAEGGLVQELVAMLAASISASAEVVSPLALGSHVDHHLVRQAAEKLGRRLWYYADYPYVLVDAPQLERLEREGWGWQRFPLVDRSVEVWQEAIAAHASQISTFWSGLESMAADLRAYSKCEKGIRLWRLPV